MAQFHRAQCWQIRAAGFESSIGSGVGGISTIEHFANVLRDRGPRRLSPFTVPRLMVNACAGNVSIEFNLRGVNSAVATACATGGHAIAEAYTFIA